MEASKQGKGVAPVLKNLRQGIKAVKSYFLCQGGNKEYTHLSTIRIELQ